MLKLCLLAFFTTGSNSELLSKLRVTGKNEAYEYKAVYSKKLSLIKSGDILIFSSHGEMTNDLGYNVMLGYHSKLCPTATALNCSLEVTEAKGYNITRDMHHGAFSDPGYYQFAADYSEIYLNTIVYAASTLSDGKKNLSVEPDYGNLSGLVMRPCE